MPHNVLMAVTWAPALDIYICCWEDPDGSFCMGEVALSNGNTSDSGHLLLLPRRLWSWLLRMFLFAEAAAVNVYTYCMLD